MAKQSEFDKAKERLRRDARTLAEQAFVLQAFTEGRFLTAEDVAEAFADWQPPSEQQVEQRAAQELVAAAGHARHLEDLAALAAADLQRGVAKLEANLEAVRDAQAGQEAEVQRQRGEAERWQAEVAALPEHLRGVQPSGHVHYAYAQAAEARATAQEGGTG